MEKEVGNTSGDSLYGEETAGLSIGDARHDLVNPFLSSGKNFQERILNPELKPLGEKKVHFRNWRSERDTVIANETVEGEQTEESVKSMDEVARVMSCSGKPEKKEDKPEIEELEEVELPEKLDEKEESEEIKESEEIEESKETTCKKAELLPITEEPESVWEPVEAWEEELNEEQIEEKPKSEESFEDLEFQEEDTERQDEPGEIVEVPEPQQEIAKSQEESEETVENLEPQEEDTESLEDSKDPAPFSQVQEIKEWLEEPVEAEELETPEETIGEATEQPEELLSSIEDPEKTWNPIESVEEDSEEDKEERPEPEEIVEDLGSWEEDTESQEKPEEIVEDLESWEEDVESLEEPDSFPQVQEIKEWLEEPVKEIVLQKSIFEKGETLFPEELEEVPASEELVTSKADTALETEEPEAVWQQWEDEREVPTEEIDGNAESQMDSGKAVMVAEQSDALVRRNRIITSSVSKGFGQGRQEEERPAAKKGISLINKRRR